MDNYLQYSYDIKITVNDMDFNERIKPSAVMSYFQDIATEHAEILGIGYKAMLDKGLAWIMSRLCYKVYRNPKINEVLTIKTYPAKATSATAVRNYYIFDQNGNKVITGSSRWCLIDVKNRQIARTSLAFENFPDYDYIPFSPFENANAKVDFDCNLENLQYTQFKVYVTDLDRNLHLNNSRYGDVLLNVCELEFLKKKRIEHFDINFMSELFCGDTFKAYKIVTDNTLTVQAVKDDGTIVFRAKAETIDN